MQTKIEKVDIREGVKPSFHDAQVMEEAGRILRNGGLVAFPTETVYGLGGDALDGSASKKIYAAKGRPSDNPLIVHIADLEALKAIASEIPEKARILPYETTGGLDTVAVRFPSHPAAAALIKASGTYIAAPSANTSGRPSPTTADHVAQDMDGRIDMIIDGGAVGIGIESTIVDLTGEVPMILRPGYITKEMLEAAVGTVTVEPAIIDGKLLKDVHPKAPGMKYRHYAPKGNLIVVEGAQDRVIEKINALVMAKEAEGKKTAVIATDETKDKYLCGIVESIGTRRDVKTIAHNLYDILRKMDTSGVSDIYSESFEGAGLGQAVMNRLLKAAGHHVIHV